MRMDFSEMTDREVLIHMATEQEAMCRDMKKHEKWLLEHNKKIRKLEQWKATNQGAVKAFTVVITLEGVAVTIIAAIITVAQWRG